MSNHIQIKTIGRENSQFCPDIAIPRHHDTVSRNHCELTITGDTQYYISDNSSKAGTYVLRNKQWIRIKQEFVHPSDRLKLGEYETSLGELLQQFTLSSSRPPMSSQNSGDVVPFLNPETGEIEYRSQGNIKNQLSKNSSPKLNSETGEIY